MATIAVLGALTAAILALVRARRLLKNRAVRQPRWWFSWLVPLGCGAGAVMATLIDMPTQKMFAALCMPLGLVWSALVVVAIAHWKYSPKGSLVAGLLALILGCAGNTWISGGLLSLLDRDLPPVEIATAGPYVAVCVLGGGTGVTRTGEPEFASSGDRVALAAQLWHAGRVRYLVCSGMSIAGFTADRDFGADTATLWRRLGVPAEAIVSLGSGRNTTEEIRAYATLIHERNWQSQRVGLISSAWHLPRAMRLCQKAGITMEPLGSDWRSGNDRVFAAAWLIPNENAFYNTRIATWEMMGMIAGR